LPPEPSEEDARNAFAGLGEPLFELSKCKDYVVNRGHYFGTDYFGKEYFVEGNGLSDQDRRAMTEYFKDEPGLSDPDKRALIEFLKTF